MSSPPSRTLPLSAAAALLAAPILLALAIALTPLTTDAFALFGGISRGNAVGWLEGFSTIDPNQGYTADALGRRAAQDLLAGRLPLWNPFEGLGAPLLGEMQAAALFPPTLLLLLPHGQVLEHTALQIVAGFGTFLFLRRFGLGVAAALTGGLLFEFNGVFAWLRNAVYNPVALLPWLFFAVESLFVASAAGRRWRERFGMVSLGAVAAALALYAGFPEVVYLYCLPLFAWVALRTAGLSRRAAAAFWADLAMLGALAGLLASPLLLAFWSVLTQSDVGAHHDAGFTDAALPKAGLVTYLLPYLFGPIGASRNPVVSAVWGSGGYAGTAMAALATGGLLCAWRRPAVWVLAGWVAVAVAVSHGAPVLLQLFHRVPLVTEAAFSRYLNAGWLFCGTVLAAIGIDALPTLPRRRRAAIACGLVTVAIVLALQPAWPLLVEAWGARQGFRKFIVVSLVVGAVVLLGLALAGRARSRGAMGAIAVAEAVVLFAVPYASAPRYARIDDGLIRFLAPRTGVQRVMIAGGHGITPNYGSALGIPFINYDDLPVPLRTVAWAQRVQGPDVPALLFRPDAWPPALQADVRPRLPGYAAAGVRYALAPPDFFSVTPALADQGAAVNLAAGEQSVVEVDPLPGLSGVRSLSVLLGTYGGAADGRLAIRLCQAERCTEVGADLAGAADNEPLRLDLPEPFRLDPAPFRVILDKHGGTHPVALWSRPPGPGPSARPIGPVGAATIGGLVPRLAFESTDAPRRVFRAHTTDVYELTEYRPYASAPGCTVTATSQEQLAAECLAPARLTRLEVMMNGWTATVNGRAVPVSLADDTFQAIDLPAGSSSIQFRYDPPFVRPAMGLAAATLLALAVTAAGSGRASRRGRSWRIREGNGR